VLRAREVNLARDRAEEVGDAASLARLDAGERATLEKALAPAPGEPLVSSVLRAPRLGRLLLAVADGADRAWSALYEELLSREIPLLLIVDPETRGATLRQWPGGLEGMAVYGDRASLSTSAAALGLAAGSFAIAEMPPRVLFEWVAGNGRALALNVFRAPDEPVYIPLPAGAVRALAEGKMPPAAGR
jgi:hypothetical protein